MATTNPGDLSDLNFDGDSTATEITNGMTPVKGFPLKTTDGELVNVVAKHTAGQEQPTFHAADGRVFVRSVDLRGYVEATEATAFEVEGEEPQNATNDPAFIADSQTATPGESVAELGYDAAVQGAVVSGDPATGEVKTIDGGTDSVITERDDTVYSPPLPEDGHWEAQNGPAEPDAA